MNKNESGLVLTFLGRFQPFHLGHLSVIEDYLSQREVIEVGIGSAQSGYTPYNPFSYAEREEILRKVCCEIKDYSEPPLRIFPLYDQDSCQKWIRHFKKQAPLTGKIITGNERLSSLLQKEGYQVINPNKKIDISASQVREMIRKGDEQWKEYVPKGVKEVMERINGIERIISL